MSRMVLMVLTALGIAVDCTTLAAETQTLFDDDNLVVVASNTEAVEEPPVPFIYNGTPLQDFRTIRVHYGHPKQPGTWPQYYVSILAPGYRRFVAPTDTGSAEFRLAVPSASGIQLPGGTFYRPTSASVEISTAGGVYRETARWLYGSFMSVVSEITLMPPTSTGLRAEVNTRIEALEPIELKPGSVPPDVRLLLARIVGGNPTGNVTDDLDLVRFDTPSLKLAIPMDASTPRDQLLLSSPVLLPAGAKLSVENTHYAAPGSTASRVTTIEILDDGGTALMGQLYISSSPDPACDCFDAKLGFVTPDLIPQGSIFQTRYLVTVSSVPEPSTYALFLVGVGLVFLGQRLNRWRGTRTMHS